MTALPAIVDYGKRQRLALISCVICFCLLLLVLHNWEPASAFVSAVILLISALCLVAILANYERAKRWAPTVMIAFVAFGAAMNGVFVFSPAGGDVASRLVSWGSAIDRLSSTASPAMASLQSNGGGFCRFDQQPVSLRNVPVAFGANGVQFYWSLANGNVTTFLREMGLSNLTTSFECDSLDSRALLECVSSVSLYAGSEGTQPYGFEANGRSVQDRDNSLSVYEDADALPICYSYEEVMDRDDYEHLTAYEKQEAVVRYAVINDVSSAFSVPVENANWNCKALCFNAALDGDARWSEDAALVVEKAGASLATEVEGQVDSESYLYIGELGVESSDMPVVLVILVNDRETRLVYLPSRYRFTNKQTEFLVNLGPLRQGPNAIRIVFQTPGVYDLRRMELVTEPLSWLASAKNNRRNCSWNNEIIGVNEVSGSINLPNDRMLCFSVPFDKGWSLFVDGEQVDLMRVNTMFMGAKVSSGRHDVELRYETYGLRLGACLSFIGICVLAAIIVAYSKREFPQ